MSNLRSKYIFFSSLSKTLIDTIVSLLLVIFFSSFSAVRRLRKISKHQNNTTCYLLGNGPSLAIELENNLNLFINNDILALNYFSNTKYFSLIQPKYYVLLDYICFDLFGDGKVYNEMQIDNFNKINWEMTLFAPVSQKRSKFFAHINNPKINIVFFNATRIRGGRRFRNYIYKQNLGVPSSLNVSIPSILLMINLNYKSIYLYGLDHSWLKTLFVNENNFVCEDDRHFFDKDVSNVRVNRGPMNKLMMEYYIVFNAHMQLEEYALKRKIHIVNCTKDSFIDAYKRKIELIE